VGIQRTARFNVSADRTPFRLDAVPSTTARSEASSLIRRMGPDDSPNPENVDGNSSQRKRDLVSDEIPPVRDGGRSSSKSFPFSELWNSGDLARVVIYGRASHDGGRWAARRGRKQREKEEKRRTR